MGHHETLFEVPFRRVLVVERLVEHHHITLLEKAFVQFLDRNHPFQGDQPVVQLRGPGHGQPRQQQSQK